MTKKPASKIEKKVFKKPKVKPKKNGRPKKKHAGGRPKKMIEATIQKLREAFMMGCTDKEACVFANISVASLYGYQDKNPEFLEEKETLKENPVLKARVNVYNSIKEGNVTVSQWLLERKKKAEFSLRTEGINVDIPFDVFEPSFGEKKIKPNEKKV